MLLSVRNAQLTCQLGLHGHVGVCTGGQWPTTPNPILHRKRVHLSSAHSNISSLTGHSATLQMDIFFRVAFNEVRALYSLPGFGNTCCRNKSLDKVSEPEKCISQPHRGCPSCPQPVNWPHPCRPGMYKCPWKMVHWKPHCQQIKLSPGTDAFFNW